MDIREELRSAGTYPTGPCSAWPQERNEALLSGAEKVKAVTTYSNPRYSSRRVRATAGQMAKGLLRTAGQAMLHGKVSTEIREERYRTCKACPSFIEDSKRCSECGCFMEAKTWVGGNPDTLCPKKKWSR